MPRTTDEFRVWMEYAAGHTYVLNVAASFASVLRTELSPPDVALTQRPAAYPGSVQAVLAAAPLGAVVRLALPAAVPAAITAHATASATEAMRSAVRFSARIVRRFHSLGSTPSQRKENLAAVSTLLFANMWEMRGIRVEAEPLRGRLCADEGSRQLRMTFRTWLRDLGSHEAAVEADGRTVPFITGNRLRVVTRILHMSECAAIASEIRRRLGWSAESAAHAARLLTGKAAEAARSETVQRLDEALAARARRSGASGRRPRLDAAQVRRLARGLRNSARPDEPTAAAAAWRRASAANDDRIPADSPGDLRALRATEAHAREVLDLCHMADGAPDPDLPGTVQGILAILRIYGGEPSMEQTESDLRGGDPDGEEGPSPLDQAPDPTSAVQPTGSTDFVVAVFSDPDRRRHLETVIEHAFPEENERHRAGLLLGLPWLLSPLTQRRVRGRVTQCEPPGEPGAEAGDWEQLARTMQSTPAALKAEAKKFRKRLLQAAAALDPDRD